MFKILILQRYHNLSNDNIEKVGTDMDYLVIGDYVFDKVKQPVWLEKSTWKEEYILD